MRRTTTASSRVEDSLRGVVKKSLIKSSKAINRAKTEVTPLFKVDVVLGTQDNRVTLKPSANDLKKMVNKIASELITVIDVVSRITVLPAPADEEAPIEQPSFHQTILNDPEILEKTFGLHHGGHGRQRGEDGHVVHHAVGQA